MNELFDQCVNILYLIGDTCNISYKEANIWIFVIIEPILFIAMLYIIIKQRRKIKKLVTLEKN
jgi:hypothetical protein